MSHIICHDADSAFQVGALSLKLAFVPIFVFRSLEMDARNINRDLYDWLMER